MSVSFYLCGVFMNINSVYLCEIYRITEYNDLPEKSKGVFLKKALVYRGEFGTWYDLSTDDYYTMGPPEEDRFSLYINKYGPMICLGDIIESKRDNMSKRKILKMYKEVKNGGSNEESI